MVISWRGLFTCRSCLRRRIPRSTTAIWMNEHDQEHCQLFSDIQLNGQLLRITSIFKFNLIENNIVIQSKVLGKELHGESRFLRVSVMFTFGRIDVCSFDTISRTDSSSDSLRAISTSNWEVFFTWYRVRLPSCPEKSRVRFGTSSLSCTYLLDWYLNRRGSGLVFLHVQLVSSCNRIERCRTFQWTTVAVDF